MKYLIIYDLEKLKNNKKIIISYFLLIIIIFMYNIYTLGSDFNTVKLNMFISNIGGYQKINHPIQLISTLFILSSFYYIIIYIFTKDFQLGRENIFLRISKNKWFNIKIFNIILITLILEFLTFLILTTLFYISNNEIAITTILNIFITDSLTKLLFITISLILYILFNFYGIVILLFIVIISSIAKLYPIGYYLYCINFIDNKSLLIIYILISYIILKFTFHKKYNILFERSN